MKDRVIEYYKKKRSTENVDTAVNMTIKRFWFNKELLTHFSNFVEENEKH